MFFKTILMNRQSLCFIILTSAITLLFSSCGDRNQHSARNIIVGMLAADPPFMAINNQGEPEGFDVDVAREVGRILNKNIIIKDMGVSELFVALERGRIDMMMCGLSITPIRLKKINMVHYQGEGVTTYPLVFWQNIPDNIRTMDDLRKRNFTIAVLPATVQETFAQQFDFISVKSMPSYASIIMDLQHGKVQAALFDSAITGFIKQFPQLRVVNVPIGEFEERGHGIAINKKNQELTQQVQDAILDLKNNGTIAQLEQRWNMDEEAS